MYSYEPTTQSSLRRGSTKTFAVVLTKRKNMSKIFDALQRGGGQLSDLIVPSGSGQTANGTTTHLSGAAVRADEQEGLPATDEKLDDLVRSVSKALAPRAVESAELVAAPGVKCSITPESRVIVPRTGQLPVLERFRVLEHRLNHLRGVRPFKRILVTSAAPREGKTFVSINLAITLATASSRVLLVDADMRRPGVDKALGLERHAGLAEILEGKQKLNDVLRIVEPLNCHYLSAGEPGTDAGELLKTERAGKLFGRIGDLFDWVIVDSCPILPFSDVHLLASMTDAVLMVARTALTNRSDLQEALAALTAHHLLGIVLNGSEGASDKSYYSRYYTTAK